MDASLPDPTLTAGTILNRTFDLLRLNGLRVVPSLAMLTGLGVAVDVGWLSGGGEFLVNVAYLALQYWLTVAVLQSLGLRIASGPRFPAFFLVGLVTTIGIALGLVLLVIPGIFLFVRWSIATTAVIATDDRMSEAMQYSWQETERHFWPILIAFIVIYFAAAAGAVAGYVLEPQAPTYVGTIVLEVSLNAGFIAGWHAAVAVYAETRRQSRYAEVFV